MSFKNIFIFFSVVFASGPFIKSKMENTEFYCLYTKKSQKLNLVLFIYLICKNWFVGFGTVKHEKKTFSDCQVRNGVSGRKFLKYEKTRKNMCLSLIMQMFWRKNVRNPDFGQNITSKLQSPDSERTQTVRFVLFLMKSDAV